MKKKSGSTPDQKPDLANSDWLLSNTGVATWEWDLRDDSMIWSPTWYSMMGYTPETLSPSAENLLRITHPDDLPDTMSVVLNHVRGRTPLYQSEQRRANAHGGYYWILDRGMVRERDDDGQAIILAGISLDITDRKLTEEEIRRSRSEAVRANRSKTEFLSQVSQQIRSPLNGVLGMSSLLLETSLDEKQRRFGDLLQRSVRDLTSLFEGLTDFLKIDSGQMMLVPRPFDLPILLGDLRSSILPRVRGRNLNLIWKIEPEVPSGVLGDPGRLKQVLWNLLDNAVKFTDAGEIELRCERVPQPESNGITLRFCIRDTGIGIPPAQIESLFDALFHPETARRRRYGGLGLGLAMSRQIVRLMHGEITVKSEIGNGSTFEFTCQFAPHPGLPKSLPKGGTADGSRDGGKVLKVLVVDENRANRIVAIEGLRMFGYQADGVSSGRDALGLLEERDFDLLLVDLQMPESEGAAVISAIRAVDTKVRNPGMIIIAMRLKMPNQDLPVLPNGISAVIRRPIKFDELSETLQQWLPLS